MLRKRRPGRVLLISALVVSLFGTGGPASAAPAAGPSGATGPSGAAGSPAVAAAGTGARAGAPGTSATNPALGGPAARGAATPHTVTLITGDRVTLSGNAVTVRPGKDRQKVSFLTQRVGGHLHVVPSDAVTLLHAGRLDARLFDVTTLVESGYDDTRGSLPLIVTTNPAARGSGRSTVAGDGVTVVRNLPVIDGLAVRAEKTAVGALWRRLAGGSGHAPVARADASTLAGGVTTVWLDGWRRPTLDVSVPQIGAPAAWRAGFDGAGAKVAVLDTGIDATHPDLAGQVAAEANFTDGEEDAKDRVGHGTHVASTIAGTGKASNGKYTGVAPKAKLLDGKVCTEGGCAESWILAGMQWAAEQGVDVVNMSLGGPDSTRVDPLEKAVDELTARYGTLFVIAAGNDGMEATIGSPASAESALAVGAVDRSDALAEFSSRGPRVDGGFKPEITAPGVDIVAAKSADGFIGQPGQQYATLSGTSMATPHVAGAAAILAQRHPDASPARLKALLMGSAKVNPDLDAFAQGAGRVDVAKAIGQPVVADPPAVGFGRQRWPHADDALLTRTVTYRNSGTAPLTLALEAQATGPDGKPAPAGIFALSASSVTVPAGGEASVTVTADTRTGAPDGYYTGRITATGGGTSTTTPFAVDQEVESYDVTIRHTDRRGAAAKVYNTILQSVDSWRYADAFDPDGTATVRLRKGTYTLFSVVYRVDPEAPEDARPADSTILAQPEVRVDKDLTLTVDARRGKPVMATVPRADAKPTQVVVIAEVFGEDFGGAFGLLNPTFDDIYTARMGANRSYPWFRADVSTVLGRTDADGNLVDSPYLYNLWWRSTGKMINGFNRRVTASQLATVRAAYARQGPEQGSKFSVAVHPDGNFGVAAGALMHLPFTGTEYFLTGGKVSWQGNLEEVTGEGDEVRPVSILWGPNVRYQAGKRYAERWNRAVFGPSLIDPVSPLEYLTRAGDTMVVAAPSHSDSEHRFGMTTDESGRVVVYRNGTKVAETSDPFAQIDVPAAGGRYRVETETAHGAPIALSTRVSTAWTFRSGHVGGDEPRRLPVSVVRFAPPLSQLNTAPAGRAFTIPVTVQRQPDSAAKPCRTLAVQVSYDDGRTWTAARVDRVDDGAWQVRLRHPDRAGYVSLRASARDTAGNTVEQTIIRAYQLVR